MGFMMKEEVIMNYDVVVNFYFCYWIVDCIGKGGMGEVFCCLD